MKSNRNVQLSRLIEDGAPETILREVTALLSLHYKRELFDNIIEAFYIINILFEGDHPRYKECNTGYHDLEHTLDSFLAAARLVDGYNLSHEKLPISLVLNLLLAALFHNTGYIQELDDSDGTGARHTTERIDRSVRFLIRNHQTFGISSSNLESIARLIKATAWNANMRKIDFSGPAEEAAAMILASADLMGQMANRGWLEKLPLLSREFRDAGLRGFDSEFDIFPKTFNFYGAVQSRLADSYKEVYRYARTHFNTRFGINENLYASAISGNAAYLGFIIADDSSNFRQKLRRGDFIHSLEYSGAGARVPFGSAQVA
ncbi:MAG: hypothetical protein GY754_33690 [bacterium]|nr:hypothetical protein [bacterium]